MKRVTKLAIFTNAALAILLLAVGIVCFLPIGISTAGKLSDRVYYSGNTDSKYVSVMINVYWGTEYIPAMLDVLDEYGAKATFFVGGSWADDHTETLREIVRRARQSRLFSHRPRQAELRKKCRGNSAVRRTCRAADGCKNEFVCASFGRLFRKHGRRGGGARVQGHFVVKGYRRLARQRPNAHLPPCDGECRGRGFGSHAPHGGNGFRASVDTRLL